MFYLADCLPRKMKDLSLLSFVGLFIKIHRIASFAYKVTYAAADTVVIEDVAKCSSYCDGTCCLECYTGQLGTAGVKRISDAIAADQCIPVLMVTEGYH